MPKCTHCQKPIILTPSAAERARKFGGNAADYTAMFNTHSACAIAAREANSVRLMQSINATKTAQSVRFVSQA